jgi:hypothetical protein
MKAIRMTAAAAFLILALVTLAEPVAAVVAGAFAR